MLIPAVIRAVADLIKRPSIVGATFAIGLACQLAQTEVDLHTTAGQLRQALLTLVIVVPHAWLGFGLTLVCLAALRDEPLSWATLAVPLPLAARAVAVELVWLAPFFIAVVLVLAAHLHTGPTLLIIGAMLVIGAYTAVLFSQAGLLVLDGRNRLFDAFAASSQLTEGARGDIFAIYLGAVIAGGFIGGAVTAAYTVAHAHGALALPPLVKAGVKSAGWALVDTCGVFFSAAVYHALMSRRASTAHRIVEP